MTLYSLITKNGQACGKNMRMFKAKYNSYVLTYMDTNLLMMKPFDKMIELCINDVLFLLAVVC